ncbi:MAG: class I SAM-dependent methyltransferase [Candidatus Dormibacteraeota bacterium]|nr:class I SAM-dependent methyltransferase [Candidatus Dormibacteraeota bacterium]
MAQPLRPGKRRSLDAAGRLPDGVLACPGCQRPLREDDRGLACSRGHHFEALDGVFDLWPPAVPAPGLDWFATPYGLIYDSAIKERGLARLAGRLGWGTQIDRMFRMMDEGVKTNPGEVVLDVPVGGAPPLRAAPGRLKGTYIGVDLSLEMLRRAEAERRAEGLRNVVLARGDITHLPLSDASVDRALCFNGLHVIPDKAAALAELHRVLKPGALLHGNAVVGDPSFRGRALRPWFSRGWLFFHPANPDDLRRLALSAGFVRWDQEREGSMLYFEGERGTA